MWSSVCDDVIFVRMPYISFDVECGTLTQFLSALLELYNILMSFVPNIIALILLRSV